MAEKGGSRWERGREEKKKLFVSVLSLETSQGCEPCIWTASNHSLLLFPLISHWGPMTRIHRRNQGADCYRIIKVCTFFFLIFIYLAMSFTCGIFYCGTWASECIGLVIAAYGLSCPEAYGVLVPWLGFEPASSTIKRWIPNHWTTREVPQICISESCSSLFRGLFIGPESTFG